LEESKATALTALAGLVVDAPSNDESDDIEKAYSGRIYGHITDEIRKIKGFSQSQNGVAT
jgi:hypothetical protein